jgi:hypothetical protein
MCQLDVYLPYKFVFTIYIPIIRGLYNNVFVADNYRIMAIHRFNEIYKISICIQETQY